MRKFQGVIVKGCKRAPLFKKGTAITAVEKLHADDAAVFLWLATLDGVKELVYLAGNRKQTPLGKKCNVHWGNPLEYMTLIFDTGS